MGDQDHVRVYYSTMAYKWDANEWDKFYSFSGDEFKTKLSHLIRWEDRQRSAIGRVLLAKLLSSFNMDPNSIRQVRYTAKDKPYLDGISFSISHSDKLVAITGSKVEQVGIDVERIRPIALDDFSIAMSDYEWEIIHSSSNRSLEFFRFWSAKEAFLKCIGLGITTDLKSVFSNLRIAHFKSKTGYLYECHEMDGYTFFVCSEKPFKHIIVEKIDHHKIHQFYSH